MCKPWLTMLNAKILFDPRKLGGTKTGRCWNMLNHVGGCFRKMRSHLSKKLTRKQSSDQAKVIRGVWMRIPRHFECRSSPGVFFHLLNCFFMEFTTGSYIILSDVFCIFLKMHYTNFTDSSPRRHSDSIHIFFFADVHNSLVSRWMRIRFFFVSVKKIHFWRGKYFFLQKIKTKNEGDAYQKFSGKSIPKWTMKTAGKI